MEIEYINVRDDRYGIYCTYGDYRVVRDKEARKYLACTLTGRVVFSRTPSMESIISRVEHLNRTLGILMNV